MKKSAEELKSELLEVEKQIRALTTQRQQLKLDYALAERGWEIGDEVTDGDRKGVVSCLDSYCCCLQVRLRKKNGALGAKFANVYSHDGWRKVRDAGPS